MFNSQNLGKRLAFLRMKSGLSQEKLAEQAELSTQFIGQIERGIKNPTVKTMEKICAALGVTLSEFFNDEFGIGDDDITASKLLTIINSKSEKEKKILLQFIQMLDEYQSAKL
ncbi:MAG: helix-turn-helix domain-containing protein [Faecalibacterium sp.]|nr:helix-turn-helix domain-containing protein [Ruminococcus sp.]MCM1392492.1 helix-turn-helix domain-containing protein [Ruminococcus sp.]MCM1485183.1 helix-turn-helix domain-containing protein [Faecalibacterium sp.]